MPELFHNLPENFITVFSGRNLLFHALAIVLTCLIVQSGFDWCFYQTTRSEVLPLIAHPAIMLGSLLPILGTLAILMVGEVRKNRGIITTGWALAQAAILGYLISITYKSFTGRVPPPHPWGLGPLNSSLIDSSHGFQFGFLKGGVFWGWPSSHTTVAFAMSLCLITLYPKNKLAVVLALAYAFYVGLSISVTIHWLSEFVAGAIIGGLIGVVVGGSFRTKFDPN